MKRGKGKAFKGVAIGVSAFVILLAIALVIINYNDTIVGLKRTWVIGVSSDISASDMAIVDAAGESLAETIESEGIVLTKNAGKVLPLSYDATKTKGGINVFGWSSTSWIPGGSGSGRTARADTGNSRNNNNYYAETGIVNALTKAGINYNPELYQFYMDYTPTLNGNPSATNINGDNSENINLPLGNGTSINGNNRQGWKAGNGGALKAYDFQFCRLVEPAMSDYSETLRAGAKNFSDTAIVVISRVSGESNDCPRVQYKGDTTNHGNRSGTSGTDGSYIPTQSVIDDAGRHYLEISTEEEALLAYVGQNYDKTIVLINSTNTMELGFMDTIAGLDACLIVGATGVNAATAIPKVMFDKVPVDENGNLKPDGVFTKGITPSGRTADTYAYDFKTAASWANAGDTNQSSAATPGGTGLDPANAPKEYGQNFYKGVTKDMNLYPFGNVTGDGNTAPSNGNFNGGYRNAGYQGITYMDYSEGIYIGYKWYETADTMGYWNQASASWNSSSYKKKPAGAQNYKAVVQYPFGYGQSYTTFSWDLLSAEPATRTAIDKDGKITLSVKVTNTGSYPGKEVVQVYYNPPYKNGGVEKSSVNLVAFGKTQLLQPDAEETLKLTFDVYDMASYDCYNLSGLAGAGGGYVLEEGRYEITLRTDAHNVADVGTLGEIVYYDVNNGVKYDTDPATGKAVKNQFTGSIVKEAGYDQVQLDGSEETVKVKYMKRSDFTGTFPKLEAARDIAEIVKANNSYTKAMSDDWKERHKDDQAPTTASGGELRVWDTDKTPAEYNAETDGDKEEWYEKTDPLTRTKLSQTAFDLVNFNNDTLWNQVLDQIPSNQLTSDTKGTGITIMPGTLGEVRIDAIGKPVTYSLDGPNQASSFASYRKGTGFAHSVVTAQTFNKYLAYKMGLQFGTDSKVAGISGWLGPGINIHRSPLGGRNYEYFSEDAYLTGIMAAEEVKGAKNKGVYVYLKHLALYDQESNRDSVNVWLTEQALREIYLKPFRITILQHAATGHSATGIMTAYGRIGAVWTGGSYALITGVVRNEWNFTGAVLTDWSDHRYFMNMSHALRAGGDNGINCGWYSGIDSASATFSDGSFQQACRLAAKHIIWTWIQGEYMAARYNPTADGEIIYSGNAVSNFDWITLLVFIYFGLAAVGSGTFIYFAFFKKYKM